MKIFVNGENEECEEGLTVQALLERLKVEPKNVLVEINETVLLRSEYKTRKLAEGDRLEIIKVVAGG